jgi:hypothetical protein
METQESDYKTHYCVFNPYKICSTRMLASSREFVNFFTSNRQKNEHIRRKMNLLNRISEPLHAYYNNHNEKSTKILLQMNIRTISNPRSIYHKSQNFILKFFEYQVIRLDRLNETEKRIKVQLHNPHCNKFRSTKQCKYS